MEVASALRAALYARIQSLLLVKLPFSLEALDVSLFKPPSSIEHAPASVVNANAAVQATCKSYTLVK